MNTGNRADTHGHANPTPATQKGFLDQDDQIKNSDAGRFEMTNSALFAWPGGDVLSKKIN